MSNHGERTPGGNQHPDLRSSGDNVGKTSNTGRTDDIAVGDTPQEHAIVITDRDNVSLPPPMAWSPPIMVSTDELSKKSVRRG